MKPISPWILLGIGLAVQVPATTNYVTPAGMGLLDGSSWSNARSNIQDAVAACTTPGDVIYLQEGTYWISNPVTLSNRRDLSVRGGYLGSGAPGILNGTTILARNPAYNVRIFHGNTCTVRVERITVSGGFLQYGGQSGAGANFLGNSDVTFSNCVFTQNALDTAGSGFGGGIYFDGGRLNLQDTQFLTNYITMAAQYTVDQRGGALYTLNATVTVERCVFRANWVRGQDVGSYAGCAYLGGGAASFTECLFTNNYVTKRGAGDGANRYGGACYLDNVSPLVFRTCTFGGNHIKVSDPTFRRGGVLVLTGVGLDASFSNCTFTGNTAFDSTATEDIWCDAGGPVRFERTVWMQGTGEGIYKTGSGTMSFTNCLIARYPDNGIQAYNGPVWLRNVTVADNGGWGIRVVLGNVSARNCITWANTFGGFQDGNITYSCSQEPFPGLGNIQVNPRFVDTAFYHLESRAGHYTNGFFSGGGWANSTVTNSPCMDAGDPAAAWQNETQPNRHQINLGAYGNTVVASRSFIREPGIFTNLAVATYPPVHVTAGGATLRGEILHTGDAENPDVYLCWGAFDGSTNGGTSAWQNAATLGASWGQWQIFSNAVTGLTAMTNYYRCYVTNTTGSDWSFPVQQFAVVQQPAVSNSGASHVLRTTARLNGVVTQTGGETPQTWFHYWRVGGGVTSVVGFGYPAGSFDKTIAGLLPGSNYQYRILASNTAGTAWSTIRDLTPLTTQAMTRYVAPAGAGWKDGNGWSNAFDNIQEAIDSCEYPDDTIYARYGAYTNSSPIIISNMPGLIIRGEYAGIGAPGNRTNAPTILTRNALVVMQIMKAYNSTLTLDRVSIRNGLREDVTFQGGGLYLSGCQTVLTNCTLVNNRLEGLAGTHKGGGLYADGGSLQMVDCGVYTNRILTTYTGGGNVPYGGGIACVNVAVTLRRCVFRRNDITFPYWTLRGGAVSLEGGQALIDTCTFTTNFVQQVGGHPSENPLGGALYASDVAPLIVSNCTFIGNDAYGTYAAGGSLHVTGASLNAILYRCVAVANGTGGAYGMGDIYVGGGTVVFSNVLAARAVKGHGIRVAGGAVSVINGTMAGNPGWGLYNNGGTVVARNCIVWDNTAGGITNTTVSYSCSQEPQPGLGNLQADPLFVDSVYYHLNSRVAHYVGGYFSGGTRARTVLESPGIDAGDPADSYIREPSPNGDRINLGAYGNTPTASVTCPKGSVLLIQ